MSKLSSQEIKDLSHLARLELSEEEEKRYADQLSGVVDYVETLSAIDTEKIEVKMGVTGMTNVLMQDEPRKEGDPLNVKRADILQGAPLADEEFFLVRAVLGNETGNA